MPKARPTIIAGAVDLSKAKKLFSSSYISFLLSLFTTIAGAVNLRKRKKKPFSSSCISTLLSLATTAAGGVDLKKKLLSTSCLSGVLSLK